MSDERVIKRELRAARDRKDAIREALEARKNHTLGTKQRLAELSVETLIVQRCPDAAYRPPSFVSRLLPAPLVAAFKLRLAELQALNESMVGVPVDRAEVLLHTDPERRALLDRWLQWADDYTAQRLARKHPKDNGNPLHTYLRLCEELLPWLDELAFGPEHERQIRTVHRHVLGSVVEFIPWVIFQATWAPWVAPDGAGGASFFPTIPLSDHDLRLCTAHLELYRFHTGAGLDIVLKAIESPPDVSPDAARVELQELAEDIEEMRPFLVRAVRPERFIVPVAEDLVAAPAWTFLQGHVSLFFARSESALIESIQRQHSHFQLLVGFDGLLRHPVFHWRTSDHLPAPALTANLALVRVFHARLMTAFSKIDLSAMLRGSTQVGEEALEGLARANAILAADDPDVDEHGVEHDDEHPTTARANSATVRLSPRFQRLQARLERDFDCQVRPGKGSEVSIYRAGGRIFTLGRHKRNDRIRWPHVRQLLRQLGIAEDDWVRSIAGR